MSIVVDDGGYDVLSRIAAHGETRIDDAAAASSTALSPWQCLRGFTPDYADTA